MTGEYYVGYFRGRKTIQRRASVGGARSVFVKLQGNKNELVYPTFGGFIQNPFKGAGKMFAGDLMEFRTDENGVNPELYFLKTYLVKSASGTTVNIARDGYKHVPFVGDKLGVAPAEIGGAMEANTVTAVKQAVVDGVDVWALTMSAAITAKEGDILVEAGEDGKMLVKAINAVAPTDLDMKDAPATGDEDFDGARYSYTPALGGLMYINKMSPLPECVLALNAAKVNGWFQVKSV
jgi:hypothetical protein